MKYKNKDKITDAFEITQEYFDSLWSFDKTKHKNKALAKSYKKEINHKMYLTVHGNKADLFVETPEGEVEAKVGDWILTEEDGDKRVVKKNVFIKDYKRIEQE